MASSLDARPDSGGAPDWLTAVRRYLLFSAAGNLLWEIAQLPLYTIWRTVSPGTVAFDILHCTAGDMIIAGISLLAGLVLLGGRHWPASSRGPVAGCAVLIGFGYTIYSEHLNTAVLHAWAYSDLMPVVPGLGIGLAPLAQWVVVPLMSFWFAGHANRPMASPPGDRI